ncbi:hypothetical protein IG193_07835 [Infirmifilum lucidum]|uniref:Bacterial repeat domain-containing protein n=1 Tax=Infirmifilum lucidum TaxID=2776706 RepID=A0A7L9FIP6_9CREN|nr:hypothetical protein [Infirmifilum lucidum]QOJ78655.1 hypothetical protein IG193_07835 [Infirmifilum lucidum]
MELQTFVKKVVIIVALLLLLVLPGKLRAQPSYYVGNQVIIKSLQSVVVIAYISPIGVDWETWKQQYYVGHEQEYAIGLTNRVILMFGASDVKLLGTGADDANHIVYSIVEVDLRNARYSNPQDGVVVFIDPFKVEGRGWFDKVEVYAERGVKIYSASPSPKVSSPSYVLWENPSYEAAPSKYTIELKPRVTIIASGLPPGLTATVKVNGYPKGSTSSSGLTLYLDEGNYLIEVEKTVYKDDYTRFTCSNNVQSIYLASAQTLTFTYTLEVRLDIVSGIPVEVYLDNIRSRTPATFWLTSGTTYRLSAQASIPLDATPTYRKSLVFSHWSDGVKDNPRIIALQNPAKLEAIYAEKTEVLVDVRSQVGVVEGGGWYPLGSTVKVKVVDKVVQGGRGERYVFKGWSGDISSNSPEVTFTADRPVRLEAIWAKQYYLEVVSEQGSATGSGWYDEGATAYASINTTIIPIDDKSRWAFQGWSGDARGQGQRSEPIVMNSPKVAVAKWAKEYKVSVYSPVGEIYVCRGDGTCMRNLGKSYSGWHPEGSSIEVGVKETSIGFPVRDVFAGWRGLGPYDSEEVSRGVAYIRVDAPKELEAEWRKDYTPLATILAVISLLGALSVFLAAKGYVARVPLLQALKKTTVKGRGVEGTRVRDYCLERIHEAEGKLKKLEEMKGELDPEVYGKLRQEYLDELEKIRKECPYS